jgi:folate-binding protein YgfZ
MDDFAAAPMPEFSLFPLLGPAAPARLATAGVDVGALADGPPLAHVEVGALWIARVRELGVDGFWLGGAPVDVASLREKLAAMVPELDAGVAEAARIDALEPRFGVEITADYFPMEVGLGGAIDYEKGCYLGQEPIVRVRDRGHINWRLVGLEVAGAADPHPGDPLTSDVKPKAGKITSAARLPDGRGVALAMAHVSLPVGAIVHVGADGIEARIRAEAG